MLRRVQITNPGDSKYLLGQYVDRYEFADEVERVARLGGQAPVAEPVILGTLKVASNIDSSGCRALRSSVPPASLPRLPSRARSTTCSTLSPTSSSVRRSRLVPASSLTPTPS